MKHKDFESGYRAYEREFMQNACTDFESQSSNNRVQYLKKVYRHLILSRLFARKEHTVTTIFQNRYTDKLRSSEQMGTFVRKFAKRIITNLGDEAFESIKTDVRRTMCDMFPHKKVRGGFFMDYVVDMDIINDRKFGLDTIGKGMVIEYVNQNQNLSFRNPGEAQQAIAPRMSEIKKSQRKK